MDVHQLLGIGPTDGRDAARRVWSRLSAQVGPQAGGTDELLRLVTAAFREVDRRVVALPASVDPALVLGVDPGATEDDVRGAFRRLAPLVHPDTGGTDELFRIVDAAEESLLHPPAPGQWAASWTATWAPPRPDRPFQTDTGVARRDPPTWRSWMTVAIDVALVVAAAIAVAGVARLTRPSTPASTVYALGIPTLIALAAGRTVLRSLLAALTRALRSYNSPAGAEPHVFLEECCLDSPVNRIAGDRLYAVYLRWCRRREVEGVSEWAFIEHLRRYGLLHVQAQGWKTGLWIGVRLRREVK